LIYLASHYVSPTEFKQKLFSDDFGEHDDNDLNDFGACTENTEACPFPPRCMLLIKKLKLTVKRVKM
jgi:hypothetical protein